MQEDRFRQILREHWGYPDFRGVQREIIDSIASGRDTLGLMPTGGGKSITFQVPALAMPGTCIVVTPLIALMIDQVANLRRRGIAAAAIHSGMSHDEILATLENCVFGAVKLLYVSPERLSSPLFLTKISHTNVSFITVDEAHCICQWGYDFRPSYLGIIHIREVLRNAPVLALTATATPQVVDDIQERLGFREKNVFRMSFERSNLAYVVRLTGDKLGEMVHILESVGGSAIVYVRSRVRAKDIASELEQTGMSATYYHAGLETSLKNTRQRQWTEGKVRIMVATNAFGMGIDKPDVRLVIHYDCPDSIEAYFQEAGRAGRDGLKSYAVLLYNDNETGKLRRHIEEEFPPREYIAQVYEHVAYFFQVAEGSGAGIPFEFNIEKFCQRFRHFPLRVNAALHILHRAGYIEYSEEEDRSARVMFILSRDDLYRLRGNSALDDAVIEALLRRYTGLFVDYQPIDEETLARTLGCTPQEVHQSLKSLGRAHIISFIPRKVTPLIRYVQNRANPERLVIPRAVYEERREQYAARIDAIVAYASGDALCRSRQLLAYFGEDRATDCGQCDVCVGRHAKPKVTDAQAAAERQIMRILADGQRHHITETDQIALPSPIVDEALRHLLHERAIVQADGYIMVCGGRE